MATRFYLPSTGAATISPDYSTSWYNTTGYGASRLKAVKVKIGSADADLYLNDSDASDRHFCAGMWISESLAAQTIQAQTVGVSIKCYEAGTNANMYIHWIIRVVHQDLTFNATNVVDFRSDNNEMNGAGTGAWSRYDSVTSNAVTTVLGDRLVMEVGGGGDPATGYAHDSHIIIGDNNGSDLNAADNDNTGDPWIDFGTDTLVFEEPSTFIPRLILVS